MKKLVSWKDRTKSTKIEAGKYYILRTRNRDNSLSVADSLFGAKNDTKIEEALIEIAREYINDHMEQFEKIQMNAFDMARVMPNQRNVDLTWVMMSHFMIEQWEWQLHETTPEKSKKDFEKVTKRTDKK